jgi:CRP/FNR family transcriptional regulator
MPDHSGLEKLFIHFGQDIFNKITVESSIKELPKNKELIREGQYVKAVPIVLTGLAEVSIRKENKELLLYYIRPGESCIMSFLASLKNEKSKVFAITKEETKAILIPGDRISRWVMEYPGFNQLFYQQFDLRMTEFISSLTHLIYDRLDKRLIDYLKEKKIITNKNPIKISHKEIANDLGTAREVVSRLIKKLEHQNLLKQHHDSIELF